MASRLVDVDALLDESHATANAREVASLDMDAAYTTNGDQPTAPEESDAGHKTQHDARVEGEEPQPRSPSGEHGGGPAAEDAAAGTNGDDQSRDRVPRDEDRPHSRPRDDGHEGGGRGSRERDYGYARDHHRDHRDYRERDRRGGDHHPSHRSSRDYDRYDRHDRYDRSRGHRGGHRGGPSHHPDYWDARGGGDYARPTYREMQRDSGRGGGSSYGGGRGRPHDDAGERRSLSPEAKAAHKEAEAREDAAQMQRDELTVLVQRIHPRADDFELFEFFSQAGTVNDIRLIKDPRSGRSRGVAYVEFDHTEGALRAMALNGIAFMGQPLLVQATMAERNRQASKKAAKDDEGGGENGAANGGGSGADALTVPSTTKLFIRNLHPSVEETDLKEVLAEFGQLSEVKIIDLRAEGDLRPCTATAEFADPVQAAECMKGLDGYELASFKLKIDYAQVPIAAAALSLPPAPSAPLQALSNGNAATPSGVTAPQAATTGQSLPAEALIVHNMFDPDGKDAREDKYFFPDLLEEMMEESAKFGKVVDACVDPTSAGCIYVQFAQVEDSARAAVSLTGRWFGGKQLSTTYLSPGAFAQMKSEPRMVTPADIK
mmetsp:Transcript_7336/g.19976  ORF Transcript_7336/g.19976 Transcript_7336/m.19976 type:complete len:603 (-) Transcript_7336:1127-2935(-)